jgi:hypothetical protein
MQTVLSPSTAGAASGSDNNPPSSRPLPRITVNLREAAQMLGQSTITVRRLIKRGLLHPLRTTRHVQFAVDELRRYASDPGNQVRHTRLAPQCLPGSQHYLKAVAASQQNRKLTAKLKH